MHWIADEDDNLDVRDVVEPNCSVVRNTSRSVDWQASSTRETFGLTKRLRSVSAALDSVVNTRYDCLRICSISSRSNIVNFSGVLFLVMIAKLCILIIGLPGGLVSLLSLAVSSVF